MKKSFFHLVFLVQTDTTIGLLSKDTHRLSKIKQRDKKKPFLKSVSSFKTLKDETRVPVKFKKFIRRKKKTTFIYPNKKAIRVVQNISHQKFLQKFGWFYSTSANKSGENFDFNYIKDKVDIIVFNQFGFLDKTSSALYALNKEYIRRKR